MNTYSIKKILAPIDLSHTSLNALDTAVSIARNHNAALTSLNVSEAFVSLPTENILNTGFSRNSDVLNALAGAILHKSDVSAEIIQRDGQVVESVIAASVKGAFDLIVVGTHGASGYRNGFVGSNAYGIIKYAFCPVLIIPPQEKYTAFKKVLFPIRPVAGALIRYDVVCHFFLLHQILKSLDSRILKSKEIQLFWIKL